MSWSISGSLPYVNLHSLISVFCVFSSGTVNKYDDDYFVLQHNCS